MSPDKIPTLTEEQLRSIKALYFADVTSPHLDDVPDDTVEYYYRLLDMCCDA